MYIIIIVIIIMCPFNVRALIETTTTTTTTTIITIAGPPKSLFRYCVRILYTTENENDFARNALRRRYYINVVNSRTDDSKMCKVPAAATELIVYYNIRRS